MKKIVLRITSKINNFVKAIQFNYNLGIVLGKKTIIISYIM